VSRYRRFPTHTKTTLVDNLQEFLTDDTYYKTGSSDWDDIIAKEQLIELSSYGLSVIVL